MSDSVASSSLTESTELILDEKAIINKEPQPPAKMDIMPMPQEPPVREPQPSTSFAPEPVIDEEIRGFVEIPCAPTNYQHRRSARKASCSKMSVCPFCGKQFYSYRVLIVHVTLNHVTESQAKANMHILNSLMKECRMCEFTTPHYSHLKRHMISKHKNYEPFECTFCDFRTSMQVTLRRHVRFNHTNRKIYQCTKCDFKALTNFSKQIHINTMHMEKDEFHCSACDFSTAYVSNLKKHIKLNHTDVKAHQCSFCDYKTDSMKKLKNHIQTKHSNEKMFQCTLCSYKADQFINFKRHLAFKHCQVYKIISTLSPYI